MKLQLKGILPFDNTNIGKGSYSMKRVKWHLKGFLSIENTLERAPLIGQTFERAPVIGQTSERAPVIGQTFERAPVIGQTF